MSALDRAGDIIAEHGETMTLSRAGNTAITLKGKRIPGTTEETGGSATQQRFRVKIGTAELNAGTWVSKVPSAASDTLTVDGRPRTVVDVRPLGDGGVVALYELEVLG